MKASGSPVSQLHLLSHHPWLFLQEEYFELASAENASKGVQSQLKSLSRCSLLIYLVSPPKLLKSLGQRPYPDSFSIQPCIHGIVDCCCCYPLPPPPPHFPFLIIGIDPSDSCVLDKGSTTKLCPQVFLPVILRGSHWGTQTTCNWSCNSPASVAGILVYDARPSNVSISLILIDSFKERSTANQFKDNCLHLCHYLPVCTVYSQRSTLIVYFEWPPEAPRTEPTTADWFVCWNIQF